RYRKNCAASLHRPGAPGILPHLSCGAPMIMGPANDVSCVRSALGVSWSTPMVFMARAAVITSPKATSAHGSMALSAAPYCLKTALYGTVALSVVSPGSEEAIA